MRKSNSSSLPFLAALICIAVSIRAYALPPCSETALSRDQLNTVLNQVAQSIPPGDLTFENLANGTAIQLNCELDQLQPFFLRNGFEEPIVQLKRGSNCLEEYCDDVRYCGAETSQTNPEQTFYGSRRLNNLCFLHDRCYDDTCETRRLCVFAAGNNNIDQCDAALVNFCAPLNAVPGNLVPIVAALTDVNISEFIICAVVQKLRMTPRPWCEAPNCGVDGICATTSEQGVDSRQCLRARANSSCTVTNGSTSGCLVGEACRREGLKCLDLGSSGIRALNCVAIGINPPPVVWHPNYFVLKNSCPDLQTQADECDRVRGFPYGIAFSCGVFSPSQIISGDGLITQ